MILAYQQSNTQLQVLQIQHNRIMNNFDDLIKSLEQQYEFAINCLKNQQQYETKYTVNSGLVHSIVSGIQSMSKLVAILKNNVGGKGENISAYLMQQQIIIKTMKQQEQQISENDPEIFLEKCRYSNQITLSRNLMMESFLYRVKDTCKNIFAIKLVSDQFDQRNQIEDIDVSKLVTFANISILNLKDSGITDFTIEVLRDRMPNIKQLNLSGCYMLTERSIKILGQCSLVTLILNNMQILKKKTIVQLIKYSINLNYLEIKQCPNFNQQILMDIYQTYCQSSSSLKWLQVNSDYGIELFINKLTYLTSSNPLQEITDTELSTLIGQSPPNYTGIYFENCQQLTKLSIQLIIQKCKNLKRLALTKFINLTDRLLQDISISLTQIKILNLSFCYNITDIGLYYVGKYLQIQYLVLEKCYSITDQGLINILNDQTNNIYTINKKKTKALNRQSSFGRLPYSSNKIKHNQLNYVQNQQNSSIKLKHLNISNCKKITDQALYLLSHQANHLQYLNLSNCDQITDISIETISQQLLNLQYLNLNNCQGLTDSSISMLATRLSNKLKVLQIQWCQVSQSCIKLIAQNLTNLRIINLSYCPSVFDEQIQIISKNILKLNTIKLQSCKKISQSAFIKLSSLRQLKVICIRQCTQVSDTFIKLLTTNSKGIQHLDISWCMQITDQSLFSIAKNCYKLKYLNLNGSVQITDKGIQWLSTTVSQIQYLNLTLCTKITDISILQITSKFKNLRYLNLSQLYKLTDISISTISNLNKIQHLALQGCIRITSSSLISLLYNLQKLTQININQCRSIQGQYFNKVCQFMKNIKVLEISQIQVNDLFLQELAKNCIKLTHINICYCNFISDQAVLKMLQKLPRLQKIDIQNTKIMEKTKLFLFHALNARRMGNIVLQ